MIGLCSKCHTLFETTVEDAYTPGVLCYTCYNAEANEEMARTEPHHDTCTCDECIRDEDGAGRPKVTG